MYAKSNELLYKVAALACEQNTSDPSERALLVKASFFDENISEHCNPEHNNQYTFFVRHKARRREACKAEVFAREEHGGYRDNDIAAY